MNETCQFDKQVTEGVWVCSQCGVPTPKARIYKTPPIRPCPGVGSPIAPDNPKPKLLGDRISQALTLVGITEERVSKWLGRPCKCPERRERLNQIHAWANRVISGKIEQAEKYLKEIIGE